MGTEVLLPYAVLRSQHAAPHLPNRKRVGKPEPRRRSPSLDSKKPPPTAEPRNPAGLPPSPTFLVVKPAAVARRAGVLGAPPTNVRGETYAGPAFSSSPPPGELPLPTFSCKKAQDEGARLSATLDLRRLLHLDQ